MLGFWRNTMNTKKLNKISKSILVAGLLSIVALPAAAQHHNSSRHHNNAQHQKSYQSPTSYDYAKVVNVQPVYETYQVNNPVEQCYQEQVQVKKRVPYGSGNGSYTNEILGGVVGGVVGNQVGKVGSGKARDVVTVVGAVLGASVASDLERRHTRRKGLDNPSYETVEHCEIKDSYTTERKISSYDVSYRYNGNVYHTKSNQHPGDRIRVQVIVKPA